MKRVPRFLVAVTLWLIANHDSFGQTAVELPPPGGYPSTGVPASYPTTGIGVPTLAAPESVPNAGSTTTPDVNLLEVAEPDEVIEPVVHWYQPRYWLQPPGWNTSLELGLNGVSGTSDSLSLRAGGYTKYESDRRKVDLKLYHNRTNAEGVETQNNAIFDARHDWLFSESPWSLYVLTQVFYDEFQAFDLNVNTNAGLGLQVLDSEFVKLSTTIGSGASREFGGVDDEWIPEAQFGWEYEAHLVKSQRFFAKQDYFPQWEDFGNYRLLTEVGWEVELMQPSNLSLKISATDRYDSEPQGVNPRVVNYSVLLLWKL